MPTRQFTFDYDRTLVAFHGTRQEVAQRLVAGQAFDPSQNDDDWLGHGVYFWEHAPQQAWKWAERRYGPQEAAVVGGLIRLGRCIDLLDPSNAALLEEAHAELEQTFQTLGKEPPRNHNNHKYLDCAVFNYLINKLNQSNLDVESIRAVFVPFEGGKVPRLWSRSGVFGGAHIQLSIRNPNNILALWPVKRDGRYGQDA